MVVHVDVLMGGPATAPRQVQAMVIAQPAALQSTLCCPLYAEGYSGQMEQPEAIHRRAPYQAATTWVNGTVKGSVNSASRSARGAIAQQPASQWQLCRECFGLDEICGQLMHTALKWQQRA